MGAGIGAREGRIAEGAPRVGKGDKGVGAVALINGERGTMGALAEVGPGNGVISGLKSMSGAGAAVGFGACRLVCGSLRQRCGIKWGMAVSSGVFGEYSNRFMHQCVVNGKYFSVVRLNCWI